VLWLNEEENCVTLEDHSVPIYYFSVLVAWQKAVTPPRPNPKRRFSKVGCSLICVGGNRRGPAHISGGEEQDALHKGIAELHSLEA
jgi:hypothetical protein